MLYNNETFNKYCEDNEITLLENYEQIKLNRDYKIKGRCITCDCNNEFDKSFRQLIKTGSYCYNCCVNNGKQQWALKCKYNIEYLLHFCEESNITLINNYDNEIINRDTIINGKCITKECDDIFNRSFRELVKFNGYCANCCKEIGKHKIIETNLKNFGYDNAMKNEDVKQKLKNTILEKYGVEHISQLDKIKEQKKSTCLAKYGTEFSLQSEEVKKKSKATNIIKYGVENPQQNKVIKDKTLNTVLIKYGCKSAVGNFDVKQKMIKNNLEKYGVEHHSQNSEISEKMLKNSYSTKKYKMPSDKIIDYQGYENFALDELLNIEHILEDDIITNRKDVPEIWYDDKTGKKRRHFVDFFIKSQNRCIEVKSTWTNQAKNNVLEKQQSAINLGYKYDIWIFDEKGNKLQVL
jgi:hypothetical protein